MSMNMETGNTEETKTSDEIVFIEIVIMWRHKDNLTWCNVVIGHFVRD